MVHGPGKTRKMGKRKEGPEGGQRTTTTGAAAEGWVHGPAPLLVGRGRRKVGSAFESVFLVISVREDRPVLQLLFYCAFSYSCPFPPLPPRPSWPMARAARRQGGRQGRRTGEKCFRVFPHLLILGDSARLGDGERGEGEGVAWQSLGAAARPVVVVEVMLLVVGKMLVASTLPLLAAPLPPPPPSLVHCPSLRPFRSPVPGSDGSVARQFDGGEWPRCGGMEGMDEGGE